MLVLVGSAAALNNGVALRKAETLKDVDFLSTSPNDSTKSIERLSSGVEIETFYHPALASYAWSGEVASIDELYTLKLSHSYWVLKNGTWNKHVRDMAMLKRAGGKLIPELHDLLYGVWEETHGKKRANLEKSPEEFFTETVKRVYEHDSIHASVAYNDGVPLFNKILRDGHEVAVDRNKFETLPFEEKLNLVREEVYATALERKLIPSNFETSANDAYSYALKKTITSFTKGWFPTFILDNYEQLRLPAEDYVAVFHANSDRLVRL